MRDDIEVEDRARRYEGLLGWTATSFFNNYVNNSLLLNCNITVDEINRSKHLYGEATLIVKGKRRRKIPTVHSKILKYLYLFQYQRYKKTYIYACTCFTCERFDILTQ